MSADGSLQLVTPFRGERYADAEHLSRYIAPPYDVIDAAEREQLAALDPHNVVHFILPTGEEGGYGRAAEIVDGWRRDHVIALDAEPSLYVVEQRFTTSAGQSFTRTGVIGAVAAEPLDGGRVRPHERTHAGPKRDRLALLEASHTTFESLFMLARDGDGALRDAVLRVTQGRPTMAATLHQVEIGLWQVTGVAAREIATVAGREHLYIADGHHRYETAVAFSRLHPPADRVPALIVSLQDPGLVVRATHRMLDGGPVAEKSVEALREFFNFRQLDAREDAVPELGGLRSRGTGCVVVTPQQTLALLLKPGASLGDLPLAHEPAVASLDVARIDALVVDRLSEASGGTAVRYSSDAQHVLDAVERGDVSAGVLLNPTMIEQVLAVADAGAAMPPKSTYFVPKVASGLVAMAYDPRE